MAIVFLKDSTLNNIANAIREKNGSTTLYKPSAMPDAIRAITGGAAGAGITTINVCSFVSESVKFWLNANTDSAQEVTLASLATVTYTIDTFKSISAPWLVSDENKYVCSSVRVSGDTMTIKLLDDTLVGGEAGVVYKTINITNLSNDLVTVSVNGTEYEMGGAASQIVDISGGLESVSVPVNDSGEKKFTTKIETTDNVINLTVEACEGGVQVVRSHSVSSSYEQSIKPASNTTHIKVTDHKNNVYYMPVSTPSGRPNYIYCKNSSGDDVQVEFANLTTDGCRLMLSGTLSDYVKSIEQVVMP